MIHLLSVFFIFLTSVFNPLVQPEGRLSEIESVKPKKIRVILDPGHGGKDSVTQVDGIQEKNLVLTISKEIKKHLLEKGFEVVMTREGDEFVPLSDRAKYSGDVFISIHANSVPDTIGPSVRSMIKGMEIYTATTMENSGFLLEKSSLLANAFEKKLRKLQGIAVRGVKKKPLAVLQSNVSPAIMVELGFMTNKEDLMFLTNRDNQKRLGIAFADALQAYSLSNLN
jgi:N-acetylmuramoyl-L-alanine amidase